MRKLPETNIIYTIAIVILLVLFASAANTERAVKPKVEINIDRTDQT